MGLPSDSVPGENNFLFPSRKWLSMRGGRGLGILTHLTPMLSVLKRRMKFVWHVSLMGWAFLESRNQIPLCSVTNKNWILGEKVTAFSDIRYSIHVLVAELRFQKGETSFLEDLTNVFVSVIHFSTSVNVRVRYSICEFFPYWRMIGKSKVLVFPGMQEHNLRWRSFVPFHYHFWIY